MQLRVKRIIDRKKDADVMVFKLLTLLVLLVQKRIRHRLLDDIPNPLYHLGVLGGIVLNKVLCSMPLHD